MYLHEDMVAECIDYKLVITCELCKSVYTCLIDKDKIGVFASHAYVCDCCYPGYGGICKADCRFARARLK